MYYVTMVVASALNEHLPTRGSRRARFARVCMEHWQIDIGCCSRRITIEKHAKVVGGTLLMTIATANLLMPNGMLLSCIAGLRPRYMCDCRHTLEPLVACILFECCILNSRYRSRMYPYRFVQSADRDGCMLFPMTRARKRHRLWLLVRLEVVCVHVCCIDSE